MNSTSALELFVLEVKESDNGEQNVAIVETGAEVPVPGHVKIGHTIRVDTRSGRYAVDLFGNA